MKHKAQYTTPQLMRQMLQGMDVVPVFGRPVGQPPAQHLPRSKFDPKPWVIGGADGFRYSAYELTTEPHEATAAELIEQRYVATSGDATDRAYQALTPQGVAV